MEQAQSTTPMTAAMIRVFAGNISMGANQMPLITKAWRKPVNPEVSVSSINSWVMPEKYQKNTKSHANAAQSNPFGVAALRLNIVIKSSSSSFAQRQGAHLRPMLLAQIAERRSGQFQGRRVLRHARKKNVRNAQE
jgi:translation elongation factor EF-1beta